jgi:hypothetical protein
MAQVPPLIRADQLTTSSTPDNPAFDLPRELPPQPTMRRPVPLTLPRIPIPAATFLDRR